MLEKFPEIMRVDEVKEVLKIGRRQAYNLCNRSDFPSIRIGKSIRIPKSEFIKWLKRKNSED